MNPETQHDAPTLSLVITLAGTPRPLPRARHVPGRARPVSLTGKAKVYAQALQRAARAAVLNVGEDVIRQAFASGGLALWLLAEFPTRRSERWGQPHTHKPDGDNIAKMALDCLARAGALGGDDCRVSSVVTVKRWAARGSLSVRLEPVSNTTLSTRRGRAGSRAAVLSAPPSWLLR